MDNMSEMVSILTNVRTVAGMNTSTNINYGGVTINVYGHEGQDISALADEIEERINLGVARRNAAFA